ncbi:hypothetical protein ACIQHF_11995 [Pseudarthrobacter oxydans]|uniref:hypothetical protein n=1 Tax=Pseudarthrobacter oxydans TaxID=1671 RepID=UPI003809C9A1
MTDQPSARDHVHAWMEKYQAAWASNEPQDIRDLFTEDARYETRPGDPEPWLGGSSRFVGKWIPGMSVMPPS